MADCLGQIFIACIARHHFIKAKDCQCRDNSAARPVFILSLTIKAFDQDNVLAGCPDKPDRSNRQSSELGEAHRKKLRFDYGIGITDRRKFCYVLSFAVLNCRFRSGATDGTPMTECLIKFRRQRHSFLNPVSRRHKLLQTCHIDRPRYMVCCRCLKIECTNSI